MMYDVSMATPSMFGDRFEAKVVIQSNGCWYWTAAKGKYGHGLYWDGERNIPPYRHAWQILNGKKLDSKTHLDHYKYPDQGCIGSSCVNPEHVRPATPRENALRGETITSNHQAQTHCKYGHEWNEENTRYRRDGNRRCLQCARNRGKYKGLPLPEDRTHCPQGHPYDEENTGSRPNGMAGRECKTCRRKYQRGYQYTGVYAKTHCKRGHDQAEWGHVRPNKSRYCILCSRINERERSRKKRKNV